MRHTAYKAIVPTMLLSDGKIYLIKNKYTPAVRLKDFFETRLCKLCVILRSPPIARITGCVSSLMI